jgi:hypothetical protein
MRRATIACCLASGVLALSASSAGAATLSPSSASFGNEAVGGVTAPKAFTLTPEVLDLLTLTITTTGDFQQTNDCPAALQFLSGPCTINVTFAPTASGVRTGTLNTTTLIVGGPTAALGGTGTRAGNASGNAAKCKKKGKKKKAKKGATAAKKKGKKKAKSCKRKKRKGKKKK